MDDTKFDKNRITNQISICCILLVTGIQLLFAYMYPENHVEILLLILFLSRKTFHAKQIFLLSSAMKLSPGLMLCFWMGNVYKGHQGVFSLYSKGHLFEKIVKFDRTISHCSNWQWPGWLRHLTLLHPWFSQACDMSLYTKIAVYLWLLPLFIWQCKVFQFLGKYNSYSTWSSEMRNEWLDKMF